MIEKFAISIEITAEEADKLIKKAQLDDVLFEVGFLGDGRNIDQIVRGKILIQLVKILQEERPEIADELKERLGLEINDENF